MRTPYLLLAVALIALAACGDGAADGSLTSTSTVAAPAPNAMGPGISVSEALADESGQPLLVNGFLFVDKDGNVTLASALAESFPPQPGGDEVVVEGLNLSDYELTESQDLSWTEDQVQVLGVLDGNTLQVSNTLSG